MQEGWKMNSGGKVYHRGELRWQTAMTGNFSQPGDWRMDELCTHLRPASCSSSLTQNCSVTFDFKGNALALHAPVSPPHSLGTIQRAVLLALAADSSRSHPASPCIETAFWKTALHFSLVAHFDWVFHLHFRECLISFHFEFFIVTLCQCPICQRARKSHYSCTCGKAAHLYWLLWSIQTSSGIDPSFLCLYKVIILRSDC